MRRRKNMSEPHVAAKAPIAVELEAGKNYAWCACGQSQKQPFCDGSHRGTEFTPLVFKVEEKKTAYLCQCKHSKNKPYCDGTHKTLP
jgi:CDGSH-type Zn-finger protein